jgi:hypothetical protein
MRIALCGYKGEYEMPDDWECVSWKAHGFAMGQGNGRENSKKERIWFSPHCVKLTTKLVQRDLLGVCPPWEKKE